MKRDGGWAGWLRDSGLCAGRIVLDPAHMPEKLIAQYSRIFVSQLLNKFFIFLCVF